MWRLILVGVVAVFATEFTISTPVSADEMIEGNRSAGRKIFQKNCRVCHSVKPDKAGTFGPNLHGVIGRQVGTEPRHNFTDALKEAVFAWDTARLDAWLANPAEYLPGSEMTFRGLPKAKDRADVIAYLIAAGKR
jgi:cytochrome c